MALAKSLRTKLATSPQYTCARMAATGRRYRNRPRAGEGHSEQADHTAGRRVNDTQEEQANRRTGEPQNRGTGERELDDLIPGSLIHRLAGYLLRRCTSEMATPPPSFPSSSSSSVLPSTISTLAASSPIFDQATGTKSTSTVSSAFGSSLLTMLSRALSGWPLTRSCVVKTRLPFRLMAR